VIILDTQPLSQLQRGQSPGALKLLDRLREVPEDEVRITIISPYEQLRTCLGDINSASGPQAQVEHFARLLMLLEYYAGWRGRILPFDREATTVHRKFSPTLRRRIGSRDSRIAAIALVQLALLISHNLRDFQQVPGLRVESWG
jgi:tRNA(fMet)-specific endonuclease VapC